uniref:UDP-N-acetylglucosamine diphosphorylase n=1 Tax=Albugo laibachii Nc14 TaxID=890382 RepID=F0WWF3_9STRA|nr:UDPNacetylhexosamine pyrophosphorylase putative [Albugo laibachii Nc14]|eukprot:CCA25776.1 UDPNacetylhexosamine pyrophosphorylase putative [Albugo laibachii Nc14]
MSLGQNQLISSAIEPLDCVDRLVDTPFEKKQKWESIGLEAIHKGKLAAVILAGGQGTRLGFDGPKGIFNIGLQSKKSLFQLFAERIRAIQALADRKYGTAKSSKISLLIMTSPLNHQETVLYFRRCHFFGLEEENVHFFTQGTLPCFTLDGKFILENTHTLAKASDGNGGFYKALDESGKLAQLQARGVEYLHVVSVDNALCKVADPVFVGYCISKDADCGNKVVWKACSDENVGIVAKTNSRFCVVEYSEMDEKTSQLRDESGSLRFGAGNICNHFFTIDFIMNKVLTNFQLDYHVAHKKIPMVDDHGCTFTPVNNSGIKLEAFIFDTFPLSEQMAVLTVPREQEFGPVKNQPGSERDSPDTARAMLSCEAKSWLLSRSQETLSHKQALEFETFLREIDIFEISPLLSYNGEGLNETVRKLYDQFSSHAFEGRSLYLEV